MKEIPHKLKEYLKKIMPLSLEDMSNAKSRWDMIAKPLDGMGIFEEMITRLCAIQRRDIPDISKRALLVFCADNGIVEEGISQSGQEVTLSVAKSLAKGSASATTMAKIVGVDVYPVDIGIATDDASMYALGVLNKKIAFGTKNFLKEPAMTQGQMLEAIYMGISLVKILVDKGYTILCTGEMGIGNTTTSAAIASVLLSKEVDKVTGKGAGLGAAGLEKKIEIIKKGLTFHGLDSGDFYEISKEERELEVLRILQCVGGLDIAALVGVYIGGALYHIPIVIDGAIAGVAALMASMLCTDVRDYMFASHRSKEPLARYLIERLGIPAPIHAQMGLGEGSGALMLLPLLDMALAVYQNNGSFFDIDVKPYRRFV